MILLWHFVHVVLMLVVPKVPRVPMVPWVPMVPVVSMVSMVPIEWLCLTSQAVKHPQHSPFYSVSLIRMQGREGSTFYSDLRNASSLAPTKYYCINCHCSAVTMPIKLNSYVTWKTSETVASVQLPLNAVFFCLAEVVSHVIL